MHPISFKSTYINPIKIEKLDSNGEYKPIQANFVELNQEDADVLRKTIKDWKASSKKLVFNFTHTSLLPPEEMKIQKEKFLPLTKDMDVKDIPAFLSSKVMGDHTYALTLQEDSFAKLESEKILGLVRFKAGKNSNEIELLQTKPNCISEQYGRTPFVVLKQKIKSLFGIENNEEKRPYRNVGGSMVENLKEMYNDKVMALMPLEDAETFYQGHGFSLNLDTYCEYVWLPERTKEDYIG